MQLITSNQRRTALLKRLGLIAFICLSVTGSVAAQTTGAVAAEVTVESGGTSTAGAPAQSSAAASNIAPQSAEAINSESFAQLGGSGVVLQTGNPICNDSSSLSSLRPIMNGGIQVSIFVGVFGAILAFFGGTAIESLPVSAERREAAKQLQQRTRGGALKLLFGGAIITFILGGVFDISCLNLIPI